MEEWSQKEGIVDHFSAGRWLKETVYAKGREWKNDRTMNQGGTSRDEVIWVARK